jgi:hypothetical protein
MRLYYLTAEGWARKVLEERRVKISLFGELNDPFELLPHGARRSNEPVRCRSGYSANR